jgi:large subunit ribosomal protein L36e
LCISLTYLIPLSLPFLFHLFLTSQRLSKRVKMVRSLVSEVVGMSPYERRMLDMLKTGGASADKRMYKFAKRRLGSHKRALKKREQVKDMYSALRSAK